MNSTKISAYIGFAKKSNSIIYGLDNVIASHKKIYLIISIDSLKKSSSSKLQKFCEEKGVKRIILTDDQTQTGIPNSTKIIAITNEELSQAINNNI